MKIREIHVEFEAETDGGCPVENMFSSAAEDRMIPQFILRYIL